MQIKYPANIIVFSAIWSLLSCTAFKASLSYQENSVTASAIPVKTFTAIMQDTTRTDLFMDSLLKSYPQYFDSILANRKGYNVQIIYTQVDRGANGIPALKQHYFNVNPDHYFYPASTVKFPVSLLALQRLNELKDKGIDKNTTLLTQQGYSAQTAVLNDPTTIDGRPTIANYIKKILMVSDNDAYNRLYEFLGPHYINEQLHQKGYGDIQLTHRLQIAMSNDENRHTNPVMFLGKNNEIIYQQSMQFDTTYYALRNDSIGNKYYSEGQLVDSPMNFSLKNRISLQDLHTILISLVFPNKITASQRFNLTEEDRNFVLKYMSQLPTESTYPSYGDDTTNYFPAYSKFLLYGAEKGSLPKNIRVFNKEGDAYGQLLDVAYIVDFDKKIEFFLSAVIYCNSDGILNDDKYDYDNIGFPFMKHLGEVIYEYEIKRERKIEPDLSGLKFVYDKE